MILTVYTLNFTGVSLKKKKKTDCYSENKLLLISISLKCLGVPVVAEWVKNPT